MNARWRLLQIAVAVVIFLSPVTISLGFPITSAQSAPFILNGGVQDEMKTRNLIRANFFLTDKWTSDVLRPVVSSSVLVRPADQSLLPYAMVGTDADGDSALNAGDIGRFRNITGRPDDWTAFFDIEGMRFHDGTQVEMEDVLFSYHLKGLSVVDSASRFLKDRAGQTGTNYSSTRWLWVNPSPLQGWLGSPRTPHQFALAFRATGPNGQFAMDTLQTIVLPAYFWQGTGVRKQDGQIVATNLHPDFGWALNPDPASAGYLNAVSAAGYTTTQDVVFEDIPIPSGTALAPFDITTAAAWPAGDGDVVGSGPYRFATWQPGILARIEKNLDYFLPDASVAQAAYQAGLRMPALDAVNYRLYRNVQAAVFALQVGDVHFLDSYVPPEFVPILLADPTLAVKSSAEKGFAYLGFNLRRLPFGYTNPAEGSDVPGNDVGKAFRNAVAHSINKPEIQTAFLQNFGVEGHTVVHPSDPVFYNASAPKYDFDLSVASSILDSAGWVWPGQATNTCNVDGTGCRVLPGKGSSLVEILTPQADYDPIRAAAGSLVAQNLRKIGLNVNSRPAAFGQIVTQVFDEQNFDMWILDWSTPGEVVPDHIEYLAHSRHVLLQGSNAAGYVNTSFDVLIDAAVGAKDQAEAARLWKWAQAIVAREVPYHVLYFRTNEFGIRMDRTDPATWTTDAIGAFWTYWSWILLDPPNPDPLRVLVSAPTRILSGGHTDVFIVVRDPSGAAVDGAVVAATVTGRLGTLNPSGGVTNGSGLLVLTFIAPTLSASEGPTNTTIQVRAGHPELGTSQPTVDTITTLPADLECPVINAG